MVPSCDPGVILLDCATVLFVRRRAIIRDRWVKSAAIGPVGGACRINIRFPSCEIKLAATAVFKLAAQAFRFQTAYFGGGSGPGCPARFGFVQRRADQGGEPFARVGTVTCLGAVA